MESLSQWGRRPTQLPLYPCAWHRSSESTFLPQGSSLLGYSQAPPLRLPCISLWPNFPLKSTQRLSFMSKKGLSSPRPISTPDSRSQVKVQTHLHGSAGWMTMNASHSRLREAPACPQTSSLSVPWGWFCGCFWCPTRMQCVRKETLLLPFTVLRSK